MNEDQIKRCAGLVKELSEITQCHVGEMLLALEGYAFSDEEINRIHELLEEK